MGYGTTLGDEALKMKPRAPKNLSFFLSSFPASVEAACQGAPEGVARALGLNHNDVVYRGQTNRRPGFRAAKDGLMARSF